MKGNGQLEGRDPSGRFAKGNKLTPGNPFMSRVSDWRLAAASAVNNEDIIAAMVALVDAARAGEPWAIKELLDRTLGRAHQTLQVDQQTDVRQELVIRVEMDGTQVT